MTRPERISIAALLVCLGCDPNLAPMTFDCAPNQGNPVAVHAAKDRQVADGTALTEISADVLPATIAVRRDLTLSSSAGGFLPAGASSIAAAPTFCGKATVMLRSPRSPGIAIINLSFANERASDTITFVRAWPDSILILPDLSQVKDTSSSGTTLTIRLFRLAGLVSPGTLVRLRAVDANNVEFGVFQPQTLLMDSLFTAKFTVGTGHEGAATITATVDTIGGLIVGRTTLQVVK